MNRMLRVRRFHRWLLRPVLLVLALAQLFAVLGPSFDRAEDRDIGVHVESEGTRVHYVHDDAACPACQAHHLIGRIEAPERLVSMDAHALGAILATPVILPAQRAHHPASPRAPPVDRMV